MHHFPPSITDERIMRGMDIRAEYELNGDRDAFLKKWEKMGPMANDPSGERGAYDLALLKGDLDAAGRALADPRLTGIGNADGAINDPVALHRAFVAFLLGHADEARQFSDQAIAAYHAQAWAPRQGPWAKMGEARAEAYAGRTEEAIRDAKAALDEEIPRDAFSSLAMRDEYGQILVICNRRDEAIAVVREMMSLPTVPHTPTGLRFDPVWSRMKDDPRFEEILSAAKPL
jgi:tetratricopeptide (TPR) repeat protein